jgi:hypothetical protein
LSIETDPKFDDKEIPDNKTSPYAPQPVLPQGDPPQPEITCASIVTLPISKFAETPAGKTVP